MNIALIVLIALTITIPVLLALPTIVIDPAVVITSNAYAYIRSAMYFLPIGTVKAIFVIILGIWLIRIAIAFVKMIWAVLPVGK